MYEKPYQDSVYGIRGVIEAEAEYMQVYVHAPHDGTEELRSGGARKAGGPVSHIRQVAQQGDSNPAVPDRLSTVWAHLLSSINRNPIGGTGDETIAAALA